MHGFNARFQLRDVEDGVDAARRRQVKLVCHCADALHDAEGAEELERQLVVRPACHRRLDVRLEAEEHLVTHGEGALGAVLVGLELHTLLHPQQVLTHRVKDQLTLLQPLLDIDRRNLVRCCNTKIPGLTSVEELEWRLPQ